MFFSEIEIPLRLLKILQLNIRQRILYLDLHIHINPLLLINISIPHLNSQLSISKLLLVIYELEVALGDCFQVEDHAVEETNLLFNYFFVFND